MVVDVVNTEAMVTAATRAIAEIETGGISIGSTANSAFVAVILVGLCTLSVFGSLFEVNDI